MVTSFCISAPACLAIDVMTDSTALCARYLVGPVWHVVEWVPLASKIWLHGSSPASLFWCWHVAFCGATVIPIRKRDAYRNSIFAMRSDDLSGTSRSHGALVASAALLTRAEAVSDDLIVLIWAYFE